MDSVDLHKAHYRHADNAAEQLAQAEAKLEEARRLKAEAEAAMNATKQEDTDGE